MGVGFLEDHLNVLGISLLQLLLQVAAAVLILAEGVDLVDESLQLDVREPVDWIVVSYGSTEGGIEQQTFPLAASLLHVTTLHLVRSIGGSCSLFVRRIRAVGSTVKHGSSANALKINVSISSVQAGRRQRRHANGRHRRHVNDTSRQGRTEHGGRLDLINQHERSQQKKRKVILLTLLAAAVIESSRLCLGLSMGPLPKGLFWMLVLLVLLLLLEVLMVGMSDVEKEGWSLGIEPWRLPDSVCVILALKFSLKVENGKSVEERSIRRIPGDSVCGTTLGEELLVGVYG